MEIRNVFAFLFVGFLMISLVAGAGYNIVVPTIPTTDGSSSGGGGGAVTNVTNTTSNETVSEDDVSGDEDVSVASSTGDSIGEKIGSIIGDVKNSWVWIGSIIVLLVAVVGAVVYFKKKR